ncbi:MAG: PAS domain S-box protein [Desulfatiglans sp.]|jgi:PAS domain S-box-containing protein|nr:PAS domain S-box protein [Thermodesulfobacteriota bacterium]MEE4352283.1 PAS domain S-box protein [Desulfatiglans sp.]
MRRLQIVIIEDEKAHFELMKRAIMRSLPDISIRHFSDSLACLDSLNRVEADLIISDYLTPGMDVVQFLVGLKKIGNQIPVIVVTGQGDENIAVRCMKLGASDYIVKTAHFATLLPGIIERVMQAQRLKKKLTENEERFQRIIENAPIGYMRVGRDGLFQYVNPQWERMYGYSRNEIIGKHFEITRPGEARGEARKNLGKILNGENVTGETERQKKDGSIEFHSYYMQPVYQHGEIIAVEGFANDLTEYRRAQDHIRFLSQELIKAQENERRRISRDLHDRVAQDLSTLNMAFEALFNNMPEEMERKTSEFSKALRQSIHAVRNLAYDLLPPALDQLGLVETISQYCEDFSDRTGLDVNFASAGIDTLRLPFETQINLYRVIQEGLNNIRKHADADHVIMRLVASYPHIILRIKDDGKGFCVEERRSAAIDEKRMGLRNMEERINLLQGVMKVESRVGQGTVVYIEIPWKEKKSDSEKKDSDH